MGHESAMHSCLTGSWPRTERFALPQLEIPVLGTPVSYRHLHDKGVDWLFVSHPSYIRPNGLYGDSHGTYGDNQVRASHAFWPSTLSLHLVNLDLSLICQGTQVRLLA